MFFWRVGGLVVVGGELGVDLGLVVLVVVGALRCGVE